MSHLHSLYGVHVLGIILLSLEEPPLQVLVIFNRIVVKKTVHFGLLISD